MYSLETLYNQLSHKVVDEFLERITTLRTPLPSPPKTPRQHMSRENSSLSTLIAEKADRAEKAEKTLIATLEKLDKVDLRKKSYADDAPPRFEL